MAPVLPCPRPALPPSLPLDLCATVIASHSGRFYSEEFDVVDLENGLIEEDDLVPTLQYLIVGKFERKEGDIVGPVKLLWLSVADLAASSLTDGAVDEHLQQWETALARRRAAAMTSAREERVEG